MLDAGATPAPSSASRGQVAALEGSSVTGAVQRCTYEVGTYRHRQRSGGGARSGRCRPDPASETMSAQRENPRPQDGGPQEDHSGSAVTSFPPKPPTDASTLRLPPQIPFENKHPFLLQARNTAPAIPSPPSLYPPLPLFFLIPPASRPTILRVLFSIPLRARRHLHTPLSPTQQVFSSHGLNHHNDFRGELTRSRMLHLHTASLPSLPPASSCCHRERCLPVTRASLP